MGLFGSAEPMDMGMVTRAESVPVDEGHDFDPSKISSRLKLDPPNVVTNVVGSNAIGCGFGVHPYPPNSIYVAKFKVLNSMRNDGSNMMLGITDKTMSAEDWVGGNGGSWAINRNIGRKCHKGVGKDYAKGLAKQVNFEEIHIILDTIEGAVSFMVGGRSFGVAYKEKSFKKKKYYPAVSINDYHDKIEFMYFGPI